MKNLILIQTAFFCMIMTLAGSADAKRYIVAGSNAATLKQAVADEGGVVDHDLVYHEGFVTNMSETAAAKLATLFGSDVLIEEDAEVFASAPGGKPGGGSTPPPAQTTPWGVSAVHAPDAFAYTKGSGATVCVVDTGIESTHSDLAGQVVGGENFVSIKGSVNPALWTDDNGHGTHVSGTIAALDNTIGVVGVAPEAKLFAVKVLDKRGSGFMSDVADGILSCVANGADVINMSLGSSSDSALVSGAVADAYAAGLVIVAAAGNESSTVSYPAKYPEVIAVSAVDSSNLLAYFSNTGPEVAFAAPGVSVYSTYKGNVYSTLSGTSMASPHVAGVAALMVSAGRTTLMATDIGLALEEQGDGLIDALLTVQ